mmetsp:Transcript_56748/g.105049  ORF Transcript_56748/g.105049 Transcript_56748/m.105049 type:complete len:410 (+) Transcript_56748:41-1270(+)
MASGQWTRPEITDLSDFQAWINIVKGSMGLGLIAVTMATGKVGFVPAIVCVVLACLTQLWCLALMAKCREKLEHGEIMESDPLRIVEAAQASGKLRDDPIWDSGMGYLDEVSKVAFGRRGQLVAVFVVLITQVFVGVVYVSTIGESVAGSFPAWSHNSVQLTICIIICIMSLTNRLRRVAYLSAAAALTYLLIFACLVYEGTKHHRTTETTAVLWKGAGWDYGPICSVCMFLFAQFIVADSVHREMCNKSHFVHVAAAAYATTIVIAFGFVSVGYYCYGDTSEDLVYLNFPASSRRLCVVCITIILLVSIVLQAVPVFMFLEAQLPGVHHAVINISVMCSIVFIAHLLPNVMTVLGYINAATTATGCYLLPSVCFLRLSNRYELWERVVTVVCVLLGLLGAVASFASAS